MLIVDRVKRNSQARQNKIILPPECGQPTDWCGKAHVEQSEKVTFIVSTLPPRPSSEDRLLVRGSLPYTDISFSELRSKKLISESGSEEPYRKTL
jgi:hypothetical protein